MPRAVCLGPGCLFTLTYLGLSTPRTPPTRPHRDTSTTYGCPRAPRHHGPTTERAGARAARPNARTEARAHRSPAAAHRCPPPHARVGGVGRPQNDPGRPKFEGTLTGDGAEPEEAAGPRLRRHLPPPRAAAAAAADAADLLLPPLPPPLLSLLPPPLLLLLLLCCCCAAAAAAAAAATPPPPMQTSPASATETVALAGIRARVSDSRRNLPRPSIVATQRCAPVQAQLEQEMRKAPSGESRGAQGRDQGSPDSTGGPT